MAHICPQATRVARNKAFHFKGFIGLFLKTITCIVWSNNQKKGPLGFLAFHQATWSVVLNFLCLHLSTWWGTVMGCLIPLRGEENEGNLFKWRHNIDVFVSEASEDGCAFNSKEKG